MEPLAHFRDPHQIRAVFTDIDDTLTTHGKLPAVAYEALWRLQNTGVPVVLVTGRPAGWCDHLARMWPVAGVVGENGAFYFCYDAEKRRLRRHFLLADAERESLQDRLKILKDRILKEVPGAALASDQAYRIHDLAIDFCEDVPRLPAAEVQKIVGLFEAAGATAKVSSIHVNGWFGRYDKLGMIQTFAQQEWGWTPTTLFSEAVYVGDSPNDEPAFAAFQNSVGVANVAEFALQHPPRWITQNQGGEGFAELADQLLSKR